MTKYPSGETCSMPTQTRCDRVPPHPQLGNHLINGCVDLTALAQDDLPLDPRTWCRDQVAIWVSRSGGLPERFPMNGKALCLMSRDMFSSRVPGNGPKLYLDFRRRLARALAVQEFMEYVASRK